MVRVQTALHLYLHLYLPEDTLVPEKTMFFLSWFTALGSGTGSQCLITETDSPVRMDWSILKMDQWLNLSSDITGIISNSPESGGVDFHEPEVSRNTVTHRDLEDVARDNVNSLDLLHAILVGPDHLAGLRLVLFEGLNGLLGVPLLHR